VPLLEKMKLKPAPKTIVCPDHVTQTKPHPEPLLLNCKHLNCQPQQAVYIGDHLRDIQAGNSAGMHTIAAAYGYLNGQEDPKQWRANSIALSSTELQSLIEPLL
jgi:phosphoglycolate phosphatase-like HAD superfamily hydrolase